MDEQAQQPVLQNAIPAQSTNVGSGFYLDLKKYITAPDGEPIHFILNLADGSRLPQGLSCSEDGILSGLVSEEAAKQESYDIVVIAKGTHDQPLVSQFHLSIHAAAETDANIIAGDEILQELQASMDVDEQAADLPHVEELDSLESLMEKIHEDVQMGHDEGAEDFSSPQEDPKRAFWAAIKDELKLPEVSDLWDRPVTFVEIYYLLQRFATVTIWNTNDLSTPEAGTLLQLQGMSEHYHVYDRGSCMTATPKDLFTHKRTLKDAIQTAKAMAEEVFNRGWSVEFGGFDKMITAAWVELQHLSDKHGKKVEILHYEPSMNELNLYLKQSSLAGMRQK